jgi:hypothetical protein
VILVEVVPVMREYEVRRYVPLQAFEAFLYRSSVVREEAVGEIMNRHELLARAREKALSSQARFLGSKRRRTEHNPMHRQAGVFLHEAKKRSATSDLDVVAVGSQAKYYSQIIGVSAQANR